MFSALFRVAAALVLLPAVSAAQDPKPAEKPPPCTVSGRVVTRADGTPIKSTRVVLIPERKTPESQVYATMSDGGGRFTIKDVAAGRYHFLASRTGYVDQHYPSNGDDAGALLALHAGQELKDVLFRMTPSSVITGRVNDEDHEPMALMQVVALRRPTNDELEDQEDVPWRSHELQPAGFARTDDRGEYRLFGLNPGEYYIKVIDQYEPNYAVATDNEEEVRKALGSQYAPVYYPGVTQMGQAVAVPLAAGEESQADFILRRMKTVDISGRVIGADGKPADAILYLEDWPASEFGAFHLVDTDSKGDFKMKGVAPGSYMLQAVQNSAEDGVYHANQKIDVGGDNIDSVTLAMGRGVSLSGRIEVSGTGTVQLERIYLNLVSSDDQTADAWARVKKDGTFHLLDVPEGTYAVSVHGLDQTWHVKSMHLGADDLLAKGLEVEKGQAGGTIQIAVTNSGADLTGSVMQDDKPVIGARVRITPDPKTHYNRLRSRSTSTDQGGRFSFVGLAPGQYLVTAKILGAAQENASSDPKSVDLSEHDHNNIDLTIPLPPKQ